MRRLIEAAHRERADLLRRTLHAIGRAPGWLVGRATGWVRFRRQREELLNLDARALRDVGLSRYDAVMEARRKC
ncbi:MAG: DUF1127 domain-containing protein [Alphaproteobacteria bacterium]|nr:DUF1127 domain-containing protein [Alphaproteobacteria bacterium]